MHQKLRTNKIVVTILFVILLTSVVQVTAALLSNNTQPQLNNGVNTAELIDQRNDDSCNCGTTVRTGVYSISKGKTIAQSFIPNHQILTKISITLSQSSNPTSNVLLSLSVRNSLSGDDLITAETLADNDEITFDFEDIEINPGNTYYLLCTVAETSDSDDGYGWQYTKDNFYRKGDVWISQGTGNWQGSQGDDVFFKTYWLDHSPEKPIIEGPSNGRAQERYDYQFTTTDQEDHDVYYYIEWGDGKAWKWIGPYASDEEIFKSHQWALQGEYSIRAKARDEYGTESEWSDPFTISMPKNKQFTFLSFLWELLEDTLPHSLLYSLFIMP